MSMTDPTDLLLELLVISGLSLPHKLHDAEAEQDGAIRIVCYTSRAALKADRPLVLTTPKERVSAIVAALDWFVGRGGLYGACEGLCALGLEAKEAMVSGGSLGLRFPETAIPELPIQEHGFDHAMAAVRIFTMLSHVDPLDGIAAVRRLPVLD